jgi:GNAT superfamily N-acetyltransferase
LRRAHRKTDLSLVAAGGIALAFDMLFRYPPIEEKMAKTVSIDYLKNHPQFVPVVAEWLFNMWGHLDPNDTLAAAAKRVEQRLNENTLPITLIALRGGEAVGTASLFTNDMKTRLDLAPWLAAVYVDESMRNLGIGGMVVHGVEELAKKLGINKLYLFTPDKCSFYGRQGWSFFEETEYLGQPETIMVKEFST